MAYLYTCGTSLPCEGTKPSSSSGQILSYLVLIVEATPFHLHHYLERAGRGGITL